MRRSRCFVASLGIILFHGGSTDLRGTFFIKPSTAAPLLFGQASVIDGDTLEVQGKRIRLHGIDAPESRQTCLVNAERYPCGQRAALALAAKIGQQNVLCDEIARDRYRRIVAVCRLDDLDLNGWMVSQGWAVAYKRYSRDYLINEKAAAAQKVGIWRGQFVVPWEWRQGKRLALKEPILNGAGAGERVGRSECRIKGNINRSGDKIYHVPGGHFYNRTRIELSNGERMFCSEEEARAAGWRRSKR